LSCNGQRKGAQCKAINSQQPTASKMLQQFIDLTKWRKKKKEKFEEIGNRIDKAIAMVVDVDVAWKWDWE